MASVPCVLCELYEFTVHLWKETYYHIMFENYCKNFYDLRVKYFFSRANLPGRFHELNIHFGIWLGGLGGFNEIFLGNLPSFRGCMSHITYNAEDVLLRAKSQPGQVSFFTLFLIITLTILHSYINEEKGMHSKWNISPFSLFSLSLMNMMTLGAKYQKLRWKYLALPAMFISFPTKKHHDYYCLSVVNRLMECLGTAQRSLKHRPVTLSVSCTQTVTWSLV